MQYIVKYLYYSSVNISVEAESEEQAKIIAENKMHEMSDAEMAQHIFDNRVLEGTEVEE